MCTIFILSESPSLRYCCGLIVDLGKQFYRSYHCIEVLFCNELLDHC